MAKKPVSVMWESTIACGLRCKHCKASAKTKPDPGELTTEEGFALIDQIAEFKKPYPVLRITGGNALMRNDIFELIKYSKEQGIPTTIAPSTTPLLNRTNIEKLKEAGVDVVALSIDGKDEATHDSFRGVEGTFRQLLKACEIMQEIKLPFRLLTTVTKFNAEQLPEIMELAYKLGARGWYLYMLIPTGRAKEEYALTPEEYEDIFHFVYDIMREAPMVVNAIAGSEPYRRVAVLRKLVETGELSEEVLQQGELYRKLREKLSKVLEKYPEPEIAQSKGSYRAKNKEFGKGIFVAHEGEVYPSSFLPIELGNVRDNTLNEIYSGAKILEDMHNAEMLKGKCRICEFNDICRGSRSRAYAVTGDYLAEDPYCAYTPGEIDIPDVNKEEILEELRVTNFSRRVR